MKQLSGWCGLISAGGSVMRGVGTTPCALGGGVLGEARPSGLPRGRALTAAPGRELHSPLSPSRPEAQIRGCHSHRLLSPKFLSLLPLSEFPGAAVTKHHKLCGLERQVFIHPLSWSRGQSVRFRCRQGVGEGGGGRAPPAPAPSSLRSAGVLGACGSCLCPYFFLLLRTLCRGLP